MKRFTVDFSEEMVSRLKELQRSYGFTSLAEVLRHAVRLMSYLEEQRQLGYEWQLVPKTEGVTKPAPPDLTAQIKSEVPVAANRT